MECQRVHVVVRHKVLAQFWLIGRQHMVGRFRRDVALAIMPGVKQQLRARFDAHIPDAEKQRAGRLAMALDPEQLAAAVVFRNDRVEACELAAHAVTLR
jgi:hypothetical protein